VLVGDQIVAVVVVDCIELVPVYELEDFDEPTGL